MSYREPVPSDRQTCATHGLAYDPATQAGCVLCRRDNAPPPPPPGPRRALALALLAALVVPLVAFVAVRRAMRADVGARCTAAWGCVDGADCLAPATRIGLAASSDGVCARRCAADRECGAGQRCAAAASRSYCVRVAGAGEACGLGVACGDGADCLALRGGPNRCYARCGAGDACAAGATCEDVYLDPGYGPLPALPPLARASRYCVAPR